MEKRFIPSTHRWALTVGGPLMTVMYLVGWLVFARMLPTPSPGWNAEQLSKWLVDHGTGFLFGCLLMIAGCGLWGSWVAALTVWTFRTESRFPVLTFTQLVCVATGLTFFMFDTLFWAVAAFRAGQVDPQITQTMWDIGWFGFLFTISVYIVWAVAWALGILLNPPEYQVFPRWAGFVTFGSVMCWTPGLFIIFFRDGGPFSYAGVPAMWLPITEFFVWLVIIDVLARKAVKRQERLSLLEGIEKGDEYGLYPRSRDAAVAATMRHGSDGTGESPPPVGAPSASASALATSESK